MKKGTAIFPGWLFPFVYCVAGVDAYVEIVGIDSLVPKEHLLRKIDKAVDFNRLYEMVEPLYCEDNGRPSIDPVVLFKMVLIQHLYGLPVSFPM